VLLVAATTLTPLAVRAEVQASFGSESWDGPSGALQQVVDDIVGAGRINVFTDYIGARPGDLDPWFWVGNGISALLIRELAGNANHNVLGWYVETDGVPVIDGVGDGIVFDGHQGSGSIAVVQFDQPMTKFGFYMDPNGVHAAQNAPQPEKFFSNRLHNDVGPDGSAALHGPWDGDVQALVFDISRWTEPNTWLVCFEDLDSGATPGPCCEGTDNDYNDMIFQVTAYGATPVKPLTFGGLKALYRR
jgi:hypothetical protein